MTRPQFTNRLIHETSPYLRQHAHNPVDWFPWGEEALQKARELDRPIFLSIGYSACHWCHVMEHESFEDPAVGQLLNENFISIKVDREERPDLDQIYMMAVQLLTRQGGWPMSMFLTPDLKPFYGGTYFPPRDLYGRPSFQRLLHGLIDAWKNRRSQIEEQAENLTYNVQSYLGLEAGDGQALDVDLLKNAGRALARAFDPHQGGFGQAPKFPHPMELRLLLRLGHRFQDENALGMVRKTLDHMARGGIYDQLGGGFHRYSTDDRWLVPHFEKMLYDNALLTTTYLEAFQATADPFYRRIVEETLDYVLREMTSPLGPFFSTQDADSEGEEGKFFVWSRQEANSILGPDYADLFCEIYNIAERGNWEGVNILHLTRSLDSEAQLRGLAPEDLDRRLNTCRQKLLAVRSQRIWPGKDDKILTSWNGLMIAAFAQAGAVLQKPRYTQAAAKAADYLLTRMRNPEGLLFRTTKVGAEPKLNGYLEDYSYLMDALVSLYEADFNPRWIQAALELAQVLIDQFWDPAEHGFFFTGNTHEQLIARTKDPHDNATPSGNSMAVTALLRLGKLTGRQDLLEKAEQTLKLFHSLMANNPLAAGQMLNALDFYLGPVREFAVVGDAGSEETLKVLHRIQSRFEPRKVVALGAKEGAENVVGLLKDRPGRGRVTVYICQDFTCQEPVVGWEALEKVL